MLDQFYPEFYQALEYKIEQALIVKDQDKLDAKGGPDVDDANTALVKSGEE